MGKLQTVPHCPQLLTSVPVAAHLLPHFMGADVGQSETQVCLPATLEQRGVAPLQTVPQAPQCASVVSAASQSGLLVSQFPYPGSQVTGPQVPPTHAAPPWSTPQALPQAPQLLVVTSGVSQPAAAVQSPKPSWHLPIVQTPFTQVASAFGKEQTVPQAPQLFTSDWRSTQLAAHLSAVGAAQVDTHDCLFPVLAHSGASALHALVQLPQVSGRLMLVSQPSVGSELQWANPSAHPVGGIQQTPVRHSTAAPVLTLRSNEQS